VALGLARVTVNTPQRRLDVALPEQVPVAELLPELLRHAGDGLADAGEQHGGWVLRRLDGAALVAAQGLQQQGVRDGEVLQLAPARLEWPELEYDDVVETIAVGARRRGAAWSPAASRRATLAAAAAPLAVGLLAVVAGGPGRGVGAAAGFAVAVALLLAGVVASRAYGDARAGATLGGYALPYAFVAGALLVATGPATRGGLLPWLGAPQLLVAAVAVLLAAVLGLVGVAAGLRVFVAGVTAGGLGALAALGGYLWGAAGAAAVLTCVLVCGVGLVPLIAIRFGRLPMPPVDVPVGRDGGEAGGAEAEPDGWRGGRRRPDRNVVFAAVARTEEVLSGALIGHAVLSAAALAVLVADGGVAARLLAGAAGLALVLRARLFVAVRHRVPLLVAGVAGLTALGAALALGGGSGRATMVAVAVLLALAVAAAGAAWASRPPSPYLGRAVDILDTLTVVSVVPIAASVLGLYGKMRGLTG